MNKVTNTLIEELRRHKLKVGFAESCTGGLLSCKFSEIPGVSDIFMGAIVAYSNEIKKNLLSVQSTSLLKYGAVSEEVAREMVRGACDHLKVDCAIAVTGIAGPSGGTPDKPIGTVWVSVKGPTFEEAKKEFFVGTRIEIQQQSAKTAMELLLSFLRN